MENEFTITTADVIMLVRRKRNMNQGDLGAIAFNTTTQKGQSKIKKLELGLQPPDPGDLEKIARVLDVSPRLLRPHLITTKPYGIMVGKKLLDMFSNLDLKKHIEFFNMCAELDQKEIIIQTVKKLIQSKPDKPGPDVDFDIAVDS